MGNTLHDAMDSIVKLSVRVQHLEQTSAALEEEKGSDKAKRCQSAWSQQSTGMKKDNSQRALVKLVLPQKAGKYLESYSFIGCTTAEAGGHWMYFNFKFGGTTLNPQGGQYLPTNNGGPSYGTPISGSAVVTLNGNENEQP